MNILKATKRTSASTGEVNKLRLDGFVPAVLYGGKQNNLNISVKKLHIQNIINTETFMSKVYDLDIDGNSEKALAREIAYDPVSDEPIHIDFMRITKGSKLTLEIPVKFINSEKSPGLKKGGVLNIVRRKVELRCPAENIPDDLIIDLTGTDIGTSIKISAVKLPENVEPTITDRDFVVATVAAPTIIKEPEKPAEAETAEGAEGESAAEGSEASTGKEGDTPKDPGKKDEKTKDGGSEKKPEEKKSAEKK